MMFDLSKQNYEISEELQIRKILEYNTGFNWVFDKNDNPYDYDIKAWRYDIHSNGDYDKKFAGFIEIEVGSGWKDKWPDNYYCVSFLYRKIFNFDFIRNEWTSLKDNTDNAFYLKFNAIQENCLCLKISDIYKIGKPSNRNKQKDKYRNSFMEVEKDNVIWGINNCINYISENLTSGNLIKPLTPNPMQSERLNT